MSRILVIDDEMFIRRLMDLVLTRRGHEVLAASSAQEGLLVMQRERPDLVTCDLFMPEHSGLEFLERKAELPEFAAIPVIVITAAGLRADLDRALELGASAALSKPFSEQQLAHAIETALGSRP